jgi:hypothetical protein
MKNLKFHYVQELPGDRKDYWLEFEKGTTVLDIINFALSKKKKIGYVWVWQDMGPILQLEYFKGRVLFDQLSDNIKNAEIKRAGVVIGGIKMDYAVEL